MGLDAVFGEVAQRMDVVEEMAPRWKALALVPVSALEES